MLSRKRGSDAGLATIASRADHRRRDRHRRRGRDASECRRSEGDRARPPARAARADPQDRRRDGGAGRRHRSGGDRARVRRGARRQRADRDAGGECGDRRQRALRQDQPRQLGPDHRHQPHRRVRLRAGCAPRPPGERTRAAGLRRIGREPARRALCRALCRVEARPPRPDAQPRRRIRQDQADGERRMPGLCRYPDDQ